jgi:chorismate mutase/prephenate dehydratase
MDCLETLRNQIDEIDKNLVELFEKRMELSLQIAAYKMRNNLPILNEKNLSKLKNKDFEVELIEFFKTIMHLSKQVQIRAFNEHGITIKGV